VKRSKFWKKTSKANQSKMADCESTLITMITEGVSVSVVEDENSANPDEFVSIVKAEPEIETTAPKHLRPTISSAARTIKDTDP
jgi:hypothetical protein